jgi:hypothetical protein
VDEVDEAEVDDAEVEVVGVAQHEADDADHLEGGLGLPAVAGVLLETASEPEFVMVGIGSSDRDRAEVTSLCRESGIK